MKKQIERVWWACGIGTAVCGVLGQARLGISNWYMAVFVFFFFGFLFSSLAWLFVDHLEYVKSLKRKVEELEKQTSGIFSEKSEEGKLS